MNNPPSATEQGLAPVVGELSQAGYVFNFSGHGAFDPDGKVAGELSQSKIDAHNRELAKAEIEAMKQTGRAMLYLFNEPGSIPGKFCKTVGTWASKVGERFPVTFRASRNNWNAPRLDVWFRFDGSVWHGVNIGDNDIVRCKRTKQKATR